MSEQPAHQTNDAEAYGKTVWFWHPLLVSSWRRFFEPNWARSAANPSATVTRRIRRRGEHGISRKTIARGMPGLFRCTCGDYARVFVFITHEAAGASSARHSLRPLFYRGANGSCKTSGDQRRGIAEAYLKFEPRHCEEQRDEAIHSFLARRHGLLRLARNDGVGTRAALSAVIARLDRATQYSEASVMEPRSRGVLDTPHARGMTVVGGTSDSGFDGKREQEPPTKHLRPSSGIP